MAGDIGPDVARQVARDYPGLAKHMTNVAVQWGQPIGPHDDRQLEYYAPWESDNPNPGKSTVELYNRGLKGKSLSNAVALDMLHYVGGVDPTTGSAVDPDYLKLKQAMGAEVAKARRPMDWEAYKQDLDAYGPQNYQDWLNKNRTDAYIRAYAVPAMNPDWQQPGMFTPGMSAVGDKIKAYLAGPPAAPNPPSQTNALLPQPVAQPSAAPNALRGGY